MIDSIYILVVGFIFTVIYYATRKKKKQDFVPYEVKSNMIGKL